MLIVDNLEPLLAPIVYKACGNTSGFLVNRFIKTIASKIFVQLEYSLDVPGPLIAISGPHEEFFNSAFWVWIGGKKIR